MKTILPEVTKIVTAFAPAANGAEVDGDYVSLKDAARAFVVCQITQAAATEVDLSIEQAQDVSGTGVKAIANAVPIWANLDVATSDALVRQTDGTSFTTDAAIKNKVVVFQIDGAKLDTNNGFDCIRVKAAASDATNIIAASYFLADLRYAQAIPPSAIVD